MEAGMSALSVVEAPVVTRADDATAGTPDPAPAGRRLRLVGPAAVSGLGDDNVVTPDEAEPRFSSIGGIALSRPTDQVLTPSAVIAPGPARARREVSSPAPLRLTRRGRVVVGTLIVTVVAAIALVVGLVVAGGAQATNHGQPGAGYQGMHQIVVRPGQTLWSIASAAEPQADPRDVVQQIMTANSMTGTTITAGQLLWVPR